MKHEPVEKPPKWWRAKIKLFGIEMSWGTAGFLWLVAAFVVIYAVDVAKSPPIS